MKLGILLHLLVLLILAGCERAPSRHTDNSLDKLVAYTDATQYNLSDQDVQVILTVENRTDSTAYFSQCCGRYITVLDLYSSGQWEQVGGGWGWPCPDYCYQGEISLEPDSIYCDIGQIRHEGQYCYLLFYRWEPQIIDWTDTLYSNAFTVQ